MRLKGIGKGDDFRVVEVFETDTNTAKALLALHQQAAQEMGQIVERHEVAEVSANTFKTNEELEAELIAILAKRQPSKPTMLSGWTDSEESAFSELMALGLGRLEAIRLFRRFRGGLRKAKKYARKRAPNPGMIEKLSQARDAKRRKAISIDGNRPAPHSLAFDGANHVPSL